METDGQANWGLRVAFTEVSQIQEDIWLLSDFEECESSEFFPRILHSTSAPAANIILIQSTLEQRVSKWFLLLLRKGLTREKVKFLEPC